jgi:hypothetical protein
VSGHGCGDCLNKPN